MAKDFINDNLDIKIGGIDIDISHRIGRYDKTKTKARPITVQTARYNVKARKFYIRRNNNKVDSIETGRTVTALLLP